MDCAGNDDLTSVKSVTLTRWSRERRTWALRSSDTSLDLGVWCIVVLTVNNVRAMPAIYRYLETLFASLAFFASWW